MTTVRDDPEARARRRLFLAIEDVRVAARAAGLRVPSDRYTPWQLRAEAWLWRASRLLEGKAPAFDKGGPESLLE